METMFPARSRSLPPVPRRAAEQATAPGVAVPAPRPADRPDDGQDYVARLRSAATELAAAAGAVSAVVREAVPPARHRRARCRVVLQYTDGTECDLAFLGPVGRAEYGSGARFHAQIQGWLGNGRPRDSAWLVPDEDAVDGLAIDVTAWLAQA